MAKLAAASGIVTLVHEDHGDAQGARRAHLLVVQSAVGRNYSRV